jgi:hypothetical protein
MSRNGIEPGLGVAAHVVHAGVLDVPLGVGEEPHRVADRVRPAGLRHRVRECRADGLGVSGLLGDRPDARPVVEQGVRGGVIVGLGDFAVRSGVGAAAEAVSESGSESSPAAAIKPSRLRATVPSKASASCAGYAIGQSYTALRVPWPGWCSTGRRRACCRCVGRPDVGAAGRVPRAANVRIMIACSVRARALDMITYVLRCPPFAWC